MPIEIPRRQRLREISIPQSRISPEHILAARSRNPFAEAIEKSADVIGEALQQRAELRKKGREIKALEKIGGFDPGSFDDIRTPETAKDLAIKKMGMKPDLPPHPLGLGGTGSAQNDTWNFFKNRAAREVEEGKKTSQQAFNDALNDYKKIFPTFVTDPALGGTYKTTGTGTLDPVNFPLPGGELMPTVRPNVPRGTPEAGGQSPGAGVIQEGGIKQLPKPIANPKYALLDLRRKAPKVHDDFYKTVVEATPHKNPLIRTEVEAVSSAARALAILQSPNPSSVGLQSLGFYFARMAGSNSQLSDREREVFENPLGLFNRVANRTYKLALGDLSPKMKSDLIGLAELMQEKASLEGQMLINAQKEQGKFIAGVLYSDGLDGAYPTMDKLTIGYKDILESLRLKEEKRLREKGATVPASSVIDSMRKSIQDQLIKEGLVNP